MLGQSLGASDAWGDSSCIEVSAAELIGTAEGIAILAKPSGHVFQQKQQQQQQQQQQQHQQQQQQKQHQQQQKQQHRHETGQINEQQQQQQQQRPQHLSSPASCIPVQLRESGLTQDELNEYLDRHQLKGFFGDMVANLVRHAPAEPLSFLLERMESFVAAGRSELLESTVLKVSSSAAPPPDTQQQQKVIPYLVAVLQNDGMTRASAGKLFREFADADALTESGFNRLLAHLKAAWGLQQEDTELMSSMLKRWRLRNNAARGTMGLPLWPLSADDFSIAYRSLLRSVRDRYVPIGRQLHRSLFVRRSLGTLKENYERGQKLGRGAYGEVILVTSRATKEQRVCKQIDKRFQKVQPEDLVNEVDLLRALDHPHIIRVFEFFENEDFFQMIMEPVLGGTLSRVVTGVFHESERSSPKPEGFTEAWIATVLYQILGALAYAHNVAGLIHKDLKTDNVLLAARPDLTVQELLLEPLHAMLADFGVSEVFSNIAEPLDTVAALSPGGHRARLHSEQVGGTPLYMSPEMFQGSFTEKSDVWSLGVVFYQMLTGEMPYRSRNLFLLGQLVSDPRRHPDWNSLGRLGFLSHGARPFCQLLMSKEEASRPSASEALLDPWLAKASAGHRDMDLSPETKETSLLQPHLQSHVMKVARACITSQLNLSQLHLMNQRFKHYDVSGDGRLSYAELTHVLEDVGVCDPHDVDLIIESLDSNNNHVIEYSEFIAGCIDICCSSMREHLRVAFNIFDLDGSGAISLEELRHVLTKGPNSAESHAPHDETADAVESILPDGMTVEELMRQMDFDQEGMVEFNEFERYLFAEHAKVRNELIPSDDKFAEELQPEMRAKALDAESPPKSFKPRQSIDTALVAGVVGVPHSGLVLDAESPPKSFKPRRSIDNALVAVSAAASMSCSVRVLSPVAEAAGPPSHELTQLPSGKVGRPGCLTHRGRRFLCREPGGSRDPGGAGQELDSPPRASRPSRPSRPKSG